MDPSQSLAAHNAACDAPNCPACEELAAQQPPQPAPSRARKALTAAREWLSDCVHGSEKHLLPENNRHLPENRFRLSRFFHGPGSRVYIYYPSSRMARTAESRAKSADNIAIVAAANLLPLDKFQDLYLQAGSPLWTLPPGIHPPCHVTLESPFNIPASDLKRCMRLIEDTSAAAYKASARGWHPKEKWAEMKEHDMRYLLVRQNIGFATYPQGSPPPSYNQAMNASSSDVTEPAAEAAESTEPRSRRRSVLDFLKKKPTKTEEPVDDPFSNVLGFLSFMLTVEDDYPVVYIYEIHLAPSLRNSGLGAHLMEMAEIIGMGVGVEKSMLTVFTSNARAERFYRRLGYDTDECSPGQRTLRGGKVVRPDYIIMSRKLKGRKRARIQRGPIQREGDEEVVDPDLIRRQSTLSVTNPDARHSTDGTSDA